MRLILNWLLSAVGLMIAAYVIPGFQVRDFVSAMIAAVVIGLANATIGLLLKILTFPLTLLTFGLFWFVINALMLILASEFVSGFSVSGLVPAFFGAILLSVVNFILRGLSRSLFEKD
jgi:putative membrane protein